MLRYQFWWQNINDACGKPIQRINVNFSESNAVFLLQDPLLRVYHAPINTE